MQKQISIFSFFSGSGFLDLGFESADFRIDLVNEISSSFLLAYAYSREKMNLKKPKFGYKNYDINEYFGREKKYLLEKIKLARKESHLVGFVGGPPCPDFSVGGKNRGKDGENGKLSMSYIKLITDMQPDFFLFENVKGLWRTNRHREFYEELKSVLRDGGYCTTERLINSLEFGVPQDRERIFLFGVRKNMLNLNQFSNGEIMDFPWINNNLYRLSDVRDIAWPHTDIFQPDIVTECPENCIIDLTVKYWFDKNDVENHPNSNDHFLPRSGISKIQSIAEGDVSRKSYKRLHRWRYSPTVAYGNNEVHLHPYKVRRLSVAEALAIQSLPPNFELPKGMSLSDMFKTIGNGVPFLVSKGIAQTIKYYLNNNVVEI